jgi:protein ImuA
MLEELRQRLQALQRPAGIDDDPGVLPLGIEAIDLALGGGLARGALHEIAAPGEAHLAAATGFVLGLSSLRSDARATNSSSPLPWGEREPGRIRGAAGDLNRERRNLLWIAEDMARIESGAPYGPGLVAFGLTPERLLTVSVARTRDLLWAMEEALRCRAIAAVIGEMRHAGIDSVAVRRLSLAAAESGALALLLRATPPDDASTAATRWIVGAAHSSPAAEAGGESRTRFAAHLVRNRRGPVGSWIIEWSDSDERFALATHTQPVAAPAPHRPHRQVA